MILYYAPPTSVAALMLLPVFPATTYTRILRQSTVVAVSCNSFHLLCSSNICSRAPVLRLFPRSPGPDLKNPNAAWHLPDVRFDRVARAGDTQTGNPSLHQLSIARTRA